MSDKPLSPRHARFVQEFLRDGNATQAYLRAGYAPRGAQPSASRLMRRVDIAAAITAGRQRLGRAAELSVERLAQEYARIAFASIDDFITVDADGSVRLDLAKASAAERAGIVELKIRTHSKQEQEVSLKLGKLQALAALTKQMGVLVEAPEPGLTAEDRDRYEQRCASYKRALDHSNQERWRLDRELRAARERIEEISCCATGAADGPENDKWAESAHTRHVWTAPVSQGVRRDDRRGGRSSHVYDLLVRRVEAPLVGMVCAAEISNHAGALYGR